MRKAALFLLSSILAISCNFKKKKSGNDSPPPPTEEEKPKDLDSIGITPEYVKEFTVQSRQPGYRISFMLPGIVPTDPKTEVEIFDLEGKKLPKNLLNEGQAVRAMERADGLFDVEVSVPFRIRNENLSGFKIRLSVPELQDSKGNPLVMETIVNIDKEVYFTRHHDEDSLAHGKAVLKENALLLRNNENSLMEIMHRALRGETALDADAEFDLGQVRSAWTIESGVLYQRGDALLSFTYPGTARIQTNGYNLTIVGGDWSNVTIEVGNCERFSDSNNCKITDNYDNEKIRIVAIKAPKLIQQKIKIGENVIGSFDGEPGRDANRSNFGEICDKVMSDQQTIPPLRRVCTPEMYHFNGSNIEAHIILESNNWPDVRMNKRDFRNYLALKKTESEYNFPDGAGADCTPDTCIFDFDASDVDLVEGVPVPTPSLSSRLSEVVDSNPPRYKSGNFSAQKIDSYDFAWNFDDDSWKESVAGYEGVWAIEGVRKWADDQCREAMKPVLESWTKGSKLPSSSTLISLNPEEAALAGIEIPDSEGFDEYELNISEVYGIWGITDTEASTPVHGTSENGNFTIRFETRNYANQVLIDDSFGISEADERVLSLKGKALEALKPAANKFTVKGFSGTNGFKTAYVRAWTDDNNLEGSIIEELQGRAGKRGKSFVQEGFQPGKVKFRFYWKNNDGSSESKPIVKEDGVPCKDSEIDQGICFIEYDTQRARIDASGPKFTFKYRARSIVGKYREPFIAHPMVSGTIEVEAPANYPSWLSVMGLTAEDQAAASDLTWSLAERLDTNRMPGRGGVGRGTDPDANIPTIGAGFWGLPYSETVDQYASTAFLGGLAGAAVRRASNSVDAETRRAGRTLRGARDEAGSAANIIGGFVNILRRIRGKDTKDIAPIDYRGIREFFASSMPGHDGRYEVDFPHVITLNSEKESISCQDVPGVSSSRFTKRVESAPQYLNLAFWPHDINVNQSEAIKRAVKRPLNLVNALGQIQIEVEPMFVGNKLFKDVKSYCTDDKCWTDMEALFEVKRTRRCNWENPRAEAQCRIDHYPQWKPVRMNWYKDQQNFVEPLRSTCDTLITESNDSFNKLIDKLSTSPKTVPFLNALAFLSAEKISKIERLALELEPLTGMFWKASDVSEDLKTLLSKEAITKAIASLNNIFLDSKVRQETEKILNGTEFNWVDILPDQLIQTDISTLKKARKNWVAFPTANEIDTIESFLMAISNALEPKILAHLCKWNLSGELRYYPDSGSNEADSDSFGKDAKPHIIQSSIEFANGPEKSFQMPVQPGKIWEIKPGKNEKYRIGLVDKSSLNDEIILSIPNTALPGEKRIPQTSLVGGCQNLGRITDQMKLPIPRLMFEKGCNQDEVASN